MKFLKPYQLKNFKFNIVILVTAIAILGVLVVGSANPAYQNKQIFAVIAGTVIMLMISVIDYNWVINMQWLMYVFNLLLLLYVEFFGYSANNAQRWIDLKFTRFQPSDLTKVIAVLFFAKFAMDHEDDISEPKTILKAIALIVPSLILIYRQPNLSTTICIAVLFCVLLFLGGLSYRLIRNVLAVCIPLAVIFIVIVIQPNQPFLKDYQQERILAWLEPEKYADDTAYQQTNSIMAIGSGKLTGKGLNNNTTTSVKNGNYILEPQTDFIFAIVGEELGFVGCCVLIILLLLLMIQCTLVGLRAQNKAGQIICGGMAALIGIQSFINISVATGIFPNTGLSLPFVSYGMTSIICFYIGIGFVLNVGLQPKKYQ